MDTIYNVGEEIYIKGIIKSIVIDEDGITYDIEYSNARVIIMSSFTKDQIATAFNVGDKVYLEVKIEEINIDHNGALFKIAYRSYNGNECTTWIKEDALNGKT